ncbi:hypothetical protein Clole_3980 [Cellulosilyticum lentocellum DSM 5427]|uniref:Uncharacterized protein n=1 Tax=Cellulosilyticum lentocellum (strain ATCC 49066 / DSM 5427 / NCIMB 11756 / RHM5) TaxID=642492 RepID=F2JKE3_CELLD|nr:hypothetical protein Clole_3980 [Cellulosilyticum lentocellum DSM 5427]
MKKYRDTKIAFSNMQKIGILVAVVLMIAIFICIGILMCG